MNTSKIASDGFSSVSCRVIVVAHTTGQFPDRGRTEEPDNISFGILRTRTEVTSKTEDIN